MELRFCNEIRETDKFFSQNVRRVFLFHIQRRTHVGMSQSNPRWNETRRESNSASKKNFSLNSTGFHVKTEIATYFSLGNKFFIGRNLQTPPHFNVTSACVRAFAYVTGRRDWRTSCERFPGKANGFSVIPGSCCKICLELLGH